MRRSIEVNSNLEEVSKQIKKFTKNNEEKQDVVVFRLANNLMNNLVLNSPVDTGNLRSNWDRIRIQKAHWRIYNNTDYIVEVNYSHHSPHRLFIEKQIDKFKNSLPLLLNQLSKELKLGDEK